VDQDFGAGPLRLPAPGSLQLGAVTVQPGFARTLTFDVKTPSAGPFDASIWWEHPGGSIFRDIFLDFFPPVGPPSSSADQTSVFQRVRLPGPILPGKYKLRIGWFINRQSDPNLSQEIHWAARLP
jgi:hypothetical protein